MQVNYTVRPMEHLFFFLDFGHILTKVNLMKPTNFCVLWLVNIPLPNLPPTFISGGGVYVRGGSLTSHAFFKPVVHVMMACGASSPARSLA